MIRDRFTAYVLLAGYIICAALGWDWDSRNRTTNRAQQKNGEVGGVGVGKHGEGK